MSPSVVRYLDPGKPGQDEVRNHGPPKLHAATTPTVSCPGAMRAKARLSIDHLFDRRMAVASEVCKSTLSKQLGVG